MSPFASSFIRLSIAAALVAGATLSAAAPASAQTAQVRYERALAREHAARRESAPSLTTLRSIATSYETIVRRYPRSGYSDNALWQAAGVLQLAWDRVGQVRDRDKALALLEWLRKEYPTSSLVDEVNTRRASLNRPRTPANRPSATNARANTAAPAKPAEPAATPAGVSRAALSAAPAPTTTVEMVAANAVPARVTATDLAPVAITVPPAMAARIAESSPAAGPVESPSTAAAAPTSPSRAVAPSPAARTSSPSVTVRGLSHAPIPRGDRLTFELSREAAFTSSTPTADGQLVITVADAEAAAALVDAAAAMRGSVLRSIRLDNTNNGLRVEITLAGLARSSVFPLYSPDRLVFDFESLPSDASPTAQASPTVPAAADAVRDREPPASVPASSAAATSPGPFPTASAPPTDVAVVAIAAVSAAPAPAAPAPVAPSAAPSGSAIPLAPLASAALTGATVVAVAEGSAHDGPAAGADDAAEEEEGSTPLPPSTIRGNYSLARQLGLGVSRIVIDPGHGGSDPGAAANGVTEAALVLDIALRLEKLLLDQPGFEVVLTRRANRAVSLARRTAIANEEGADVFISIHANSSPRKETAGVETYFLNLATNKQAETVAARENASSAEAMSNLPQLVRAITNNNKLAESRELANIVQTSLVRRLGPRNSEFQNLGVKQAPFMVLIGAQMPSILAEVGFLTNRTEAGLIRQNAYKQQVAQALCDAILQYQASLKKATTVAASAGAR